MVNNGKATCAMRITREIIDFDGKKKTVKNIQIKGNHLNRGGHVENTPRTHDRPREQTASATTPSGSFIIHGDKFKK